MLYQLELSPHQSEVLAVKVEVDTRPPAGATLATALVRRHVVLRLQHHDRASLLAGKLHALLQRPYAKGRDVYDLVRYLSDPQWPAPNLTLLNNALRQTGWSDDEATPEHWRRLVRERLLALPWEQVIADVRPFLERSSDIDLLSREQVLALLER
ncbi:MAG TPA: nucleotidyl transferase AbiEii/AbiGii toxin family protein [Chloroflexota bacterium]|nr:nucleotidyl transferase AbiEii/AbiGii toxin family protein [Chloroflexota bacterium]